jgi:hypothetical protein
MIGHSPLKCPPYWGIQGTHEEAVMPRKLFDIDVDEISLVDRTANRKKFAIIKRRINVDEYIALLKSLMGDELKPEDIAKAKEIPEDALKAIKGALNTLSKFKDDYPQDILAAIKALTKYASYGYPEQKSEDLGKEDIEKIGARLSKATLEELKKVQELIDAIDIKAFKKVREIIDGLIKDAEVAKGRESLPADVAKRLAKLDALEAQEKKNAAEAERKRLEKIETDLKDVKELLEKAAKTKGFTKQEKGQDDDKDKDKDNTDKWSSISIGS